MQRAQGPDGRLLYKVQDRPCGEKSGRSRGFGHVDVWGMGAQQGWQWHRAPGMKLVWLESRESGGDTGARGLRILWATVGTLALEGLSEGVGHVIRFSS